MGRIQKTDETDGDGHAWYRACSTRARRLSPYLRTSHNTTYSPSSLSPFSDRARVAEQRDITTKLMGEEQRWRHYALVHRKVDRWVRCTEGHHEMHSALLPNI
jgi:hypothetical protein